MKRLNQIAKANFETYDVTECQTNNYNAKLNISRSKSNQKMKLGQLLEYNLRNVFLQKSCRK